MYYQASVCLIDSVTAKSLEMGRQRPPEMEHQVERHREIVGAPPILQPQFLFRNERKSEFQGRSLVERLPTGDVAPESPVGKQVAVFSKQVPKTVPSRRSSPLLCLSPEPQPHALNRVQTHDPLIFSPLSLTPPYFVPCPSPVLGCYCWEMNTKLYVSRVFDRM